VVSLAAAGDFIELKRITLTDVMAPPFIVRSSGQ